MDIAVTTRPVEPTDRTLFYRLVAAPLPRERVPAVPRPGAPAPRRDRPPAGDRRRDLREAVVAVVGGEVVGVARYDRPLDDPSTAEVAVLVEDAWQGAGVGRQLLAGLSELATRRGVRTFTATVQPDNRPVLGLVRRLLPGSTLTLDADVLTVTSPLNPEPVSAAARPDSLLATATH